MGKNRTGNARETNYRNTTICVDCFWEGYFVITLNAALVIVCSWVWVRVWCNLPAPLGDKSYSQAPGTNVTIKRIAFFFSREQESHCGTIQVITRAAFTNCLVKGNQQRWCGLQSCVSCHLSRELCSPHMPATGRRLKCWTPGQGNVSASEKVAFQVRVGTTLLGWYPAKEKCLKVAPLPHSPDKMGVQWFPLAGLVWSLGWSLISTEALGWQLLPDLYDCSPGNMEVPGALGCPASWAPSEPPGVSALPWGRPSSIEAFSSSVFEARSFRESSSGGDSHHFHAFCWTATTLGCVGGAGKLQKCWCPRTIWRARQSLSGCVLGQVSREETWPDSPQALPQTWQKFITTSMCLRSRICWWSVALLGNDWAVPKNSFFRNPDFKILMFMVPILLFVSRHGKSLSKLLGCNTL